MIKNIQKLWKIGKMNMELNKKTAHNSGLAQLGF